MYCFRMKVSECSENCRSSEPQEVVFSSYFYAFGVRYIGDTYRVFGGKTCDSQTPLRVFFSSSAPVYVR